MNATALSIANEISQLPAAGFREAIQSLAAISKRYFPTIVLTEEDHHDLALASSEADSGDFASDQEVTAAFRHIRSAVDL